MSKEVSSEKLLDELEKQVEKHIQQAIRVFQNLDENTLLKPAKNEGWSIAQCLWHLNSYGHFYFPHIAAELKNATKKSNQHFKSSWVGAYFTRMMQPDTTTKKYKAFKDHVPPSQLEPYSVVSTFIHQQELVLTYIEQARKVDMNTIKIPISISKLVKLKLGDVFQFLIAHNERHLQQAHRNLNQI
jgi:hypothetical protein